MPMKCRLTCENPADIVYTLTVTMTAGEWERLRNQMEQIDISWPAIDLQRQITDLLSQARKVYWPKAETPTT